MGMTAGITDCRRSRKWGCRGRRRWDLNSGTAVKPERGLCSFGREKREDHAALAEWGPRGCDTADGAGSLNHGLLLLFLRYGYPGLGRGRKKDCVPVWVF